MHESKLSARRSRERPDRSIWRNKVAFEGRSRRAEETRIRGRLDPAVYFINETGRAMQLGAIKVCALWLSLAAISSRAHGRTDGCVGVEAKANYRIFEAEPR